MPEEKPMVLVRLFDGVVQVWSGEGVKIVVQDFREDTEDLTLQVYQPVAVSKN